MFRRVLDSRSFVATFLAMATGLILFYRFPFPEQQVFLQVIAMRSPHVLTTFKWLYWTSLFSTPYMLFAGSFSAIYVFTLKLGRRVVLGHLPPYPNPHRRDDLFLILGEVHNPRKPGPSESPSWLIVPERGLFTGIAVFGAVGSGKTSSCLYPFADQIFGYRASDKHKRIGGLVLEVKGDFCHRVKEILERCGRGDDYIEISLDSDYRYNPLHNNLDAYALAFSIASLLNNLFGRGKEPFWQQPHTIQVPKLWKSRGKTSARTDCPSSQSVSVRSRGPASHRQAGRLLSWRQSSDCVSLGRAKADSPSPRNGSEHPVSQIGSRNIPRVVQTGDGECLEQRSMTVWFIGAPARKSGGFDIGIERASPDASPAKPPIGRKQIRS